MRWQQSLGLLLACLVLLLDAKLLPTAADLQSGEQHPEEDVQLHHSGRKLQGLLTSPDEDAEEDWEYEEREKDRCRPEEDDEECEERTGLMVHRLPGGLYTLRRRAPVLPLAHMSYAERAAVRAVGKAADVEALLALKAQVTSDEEGLLDSWKPGRDPCTFERVVCDARTGRVAEVDIASPEDTLQHYPDLRQSMRGRGHHIPEPDQQQSADELQATWVQAPELNHSPGITWPDGYYQVEVLHLRSLPCGAFLQMGGTLRALHLSNVQLTDAHLPACWSALTALRELTLFNLGLTGPLPPEWRALHNLTSLNLGDNPALSGGLPPDWVGMRKLQLLDLSLNFEGPNRSGISGTLPPQWAAMRQLATLDLWRTRVEGTLPTAWRTVATLQTLTLSDTFVSGSLPAAWGGMKELKVLQLGNTRVSGPLPASWSKMPKLTFLDLRGTAVQQPLPRSWYGFCLRNGTKLPSAATKQLEWDHQRSGFGKAYILLPWPGPEGHTWELSNGEGRTAPHNMCVGLQRSRRRWWAAGVAALGAVAAFLFRRTLRGAAAGLRRRGSPRMPSAGHRVASTLALLLSSAASRLMGRSAQRQD